MPGLPHHPQHPIAAITLIMFDLPDDILIMLTWTTPFAVIALTIIAWRGWWRRDVFVIDVPDRVKFDGIDAALALALFLIGQVAAVAVIQAMGGIEAMNEGDTLDTALRVLATQAVAQGPLVLFAVVRVCLRDKGWQTFGLALSHPLRDLGYGLAALVIGVALVWWTITVATAVGHMVGHEPPPVGHKLLTVMQESDSQLGLILLLVSATVVAPLLEEVIFRGVVQSTLLTVFDSGNTWPFFVKAGRWPVVLMEVRWPIILLAAALFAVVHGFDPWQPLPGLFVLGVILGWLYEKTGSLWPCIVTHVGFNAVNSGVALLIPPAA